MSEKENTMNAEIPTTITLEYHEYTTLAAGYVGWYEYAGKVFAWVAEDGSLTYAVDLI